MTHDADMTRPISSELTEAILESISDGVFTVDADWCVTSFNRAAEQITGIPRDEALGRPCCDVFRSSLCEGACALRHTLETQHPVINQACYIVNADGRRIPISVSTAVLRDARGQVIGGAETFRDLSEIEALRQELKDQVRLGDLVSHSPAMRPVFDLVPVLADSDTTVLIQGETGTGKEVLARAIHGQGKRADRPFIAVNCGALPDSLLESELFGYCKGAFTGAEQDKPGRFELAQDGTIFLDEIGEVSPALQVRLLRVLQERVVEPLGSTKSVLVRARVIAATNRDLSQRVQDGDFREDLYYRVNVMRVDLPPLRDRLEDLPLLIDHFRERFNRLQQRDIMGVSPEALSALMAHPWPGNVRELENVIERAFVLCRGQQIRLEHLPPDLSGTSQSHKLQPGIKGVQNATERQAIEAALKRNQYNRQATARELGIHKTTLYRKMKALGISI